MSTVIGEVVLLQPQLPEMKSTALLCLLAIVGHVSCILSKIGGFVVSKIGRNIPRVPLLHREVCPADEVESSMCWTDGLSSMNLGCSGGWVTSARRQDVGEPGEM